VPKATIRLGQAAEGEPQSTEFAPDGFTLVEIPCSVAPKVEGELILEGPALTVGDEVVTAIQAKVGPFEYTAPSAGVVELAQLPRIVVGFGAEQAGVEAVPTGSVIGELAVSLTERPAQISVTFLFALAGQPEAVGIFAIGEGELPVKIGN
jgi:hypothetical protein